MEHHDIILIEDPKITLFNDIREVLVVAHQNQIWNSILNDILTIYNILEFQKRLNIYKLLENCDKKYGIYAKYSDLSDEDRASVIKYM